jgi:hypothetical protein
MTHEPEDRYGARQNELGYFDLLVAPLVLAAFMSVPVQLIIQAQLYRVLSEFPLRIPSPRRLIANSFAIHRKFIALCSHGAIRRRKQEEQEEMPGRQDYNDLITLIANR